MQHNEEKKPNKLRRLFAEKGYYIALVLCIAAVGISGYVFIRALSSGGEDTDEAQMGVPVTVETLPEASASTGSQTGGSTAASSTDSADGTEASAVYTDDYLGSVVVIDHANGYSTVYANLNTIPAVTAGDEVEAGTVIGAVSNTALGEAGDVSHLHFEVLLDGVHVDPLEYLP